MRIDVSSLAMLFQPTSLGAAPLAAVLRPPFLVLVRLLESVLIRQRIVYRPGIFHL